MGGKGKNKEEREAAKKEKQKQKLKKQEERMKKREEKKKKKGGNRESRSGSNKKKKKNHNKNKKSAKKPSHVGKSKNKRSDLKVQDNKMLGSLSGIATLRRQGDVSVTDEDNHKIVMSEFQVGPLQLEVSRVYGNGKGRTVKSAKAITDIMTGV